MPDRPQPKAHVHLSRRNRGPSPAPPSPASHDSIGSRRVAAYVELAVTTNFTFLTGASHPEEFVLRAAELGHRAAAITDHNSLAGVVRAHVAAREAGIPLVVGARLVFNPEGAASTQPGAFTGEGSFRRALAGAGRSAPSRDRKGAVSQGEFPGSTGLHVLVFPTDRAAYGRLCRLLTTGKRRAAKGCCTLSLDDLLNDNAGLLAVVLPPDELDGGQPPPSGHALEAAHAQKAGRRPIPQALLALRSAFDDDRLSLGVTRLRGADDDRRVATLVDWSKRAGVPLVAVNDVHYHVPERRRLQDVLVCVRHGCTIDQAGLRLFPNGERYLKSPAEMARLFADLPEALARSVEIAQRAAAFRLDALRYEYPDEICPAGRSAMEHLTDLVWVGARERFPEGVGDKVRAQLEHELKLIDELQYAPFFLTVYDVVKFARGRGILCQGRGAAANSAVCYCLGVTAVDPTRIDMLFERFVSRERNEPPDIDVDFEHERREEVIQYIYEKYGRERAGLTAEVITYRGRSAVRDVGKVLGFSLEEVDRLAKRIDHWHASPFEEGAADAALEDLGFDPREPRVRHLMILASEIIGFPRHLSQHVGGFVITRGPLCELVPIENAAMQARTVIEWDKDDIEAMGLLKVDVLGLGMLTCIRKCFELIERHHGRTLTLATIPPEDPAVYDMICEADTVGVFQIESRAQMTMLPRLKPRDYYDLVIEVAIVRPGPIVGDMVHPYLRRRNGLEPVVYPDAKVERVLGKTLGVPLFQEQAMALAVVAAGFTPGEAELLRRAITAWKSKDALSRYPRRFIEGMIANGYERAFAEQCFKRLLGFSEYGFPESHAASFALLVYASAWLKRHYPAAFAAALLNSQPMGFYGPSQIVRDAGDHGVTVRPIDVNYSRWDCTLEDEGRVLRLGFRMVSGLRRTDADAVVAAVCRCGPLRSVFELRRRSRAPAAGLRMLARADAFGSMGLKREQALWAILALRDEALPLFDDHPQANDEAPREELPQPSGLARVVGDYRSTGLSLKAHPVSFVREQLTAMKVATAREIRDADRFPHGRWGAVAGLVLFRQKPGTARGVMFMTLEDETGRADLIVRPHVYERFRATARHGQFVIARGRVERQGRVVHVLAARLDEAADLLAQPLPPLSRDFR